MFGKLFSKCQLHYEVLQKQKCYLPGSEYPVVKLSNQRLQHSQVFAVALMILEW